jgi:uncharacterized protein
MIQANQLNMQAFAQEGVPYAETTPLQKFSRLAHETSLSQDDAAVAWQASAELRKGSTTEDDVWLHLKASTKLALTCQRCMTAVTTPLDVNQWYRFVASEEIAMVQDDESEEDLLVMEPHFDLLAVLEDELLMALPLVPMHEQCPTQPVMQSQQSEAQEQALVQAEKPNPFAVLAQLKDKK